MSWPCHVMPCHVSRRQKTMSWPCHAMSCHVTWKQETRSCYVMWHENRKPRHVMPCHATWKQENHVTSGHVMSHDNRKPHESHVKAKETLWIAHSKNTADFTSKSNCKQMKLYMTCLHELSRSTTTSRRPSTGEAYPEVGRRQQLRATSVLLTLSLTWGSGLYVW